MSHEEYPLDSPIAIPVDTKGICYVAGIVDVSCSDRVEECDNFDDTYYKMDNAGDGHIVHPPPTLPVAGDGRPQPPPPLPPTPPALLIPIPRAGGPPPPVDRGLPVFPSEVAPVLPPGGALDCLCFNSKGSR
uniref:Uncharacterized protein n=1 Tax=Amphimedon queenslandica TaxID=400682 RepID=A0A1X7UR75_AMPQE